MDLQRLQMWFNAVDSDRSGQITATELQTMDWGNLKLTPETARKLLNLFDTDRTGSIGFEEYVGLHTFLSAAQNIFSQFDQNRSGFLDGNEVVGALAQGGFQVSPQIVDSLVKGYSQGSGKLNVEQFVNLKTLVATVQRTFDHHDYQHTGIINLNHDTAILFASNLF